MKKRWLSDVLCMFILVVLPIFCGNVAHAAPLGYTRLWGQAYDPGAINHGVAGGVAVDRSGNVVMTTTYLTSYILVTNKYDENGTLLWTRTYDKSQGRAVAVDELGNIYVLGARHNGVTGVGSWNMLLLKYHPDGNLLWAKEYGELGFHVYSDEFGQSIAIDREGNLFIAGYVVYVSAASANALCVKMDGDGNVVWSKSPYNTGREGGNGIAVDAGGNVFLAGDVKNAATNYDIVVNKFDPAGVLLWQKKYDGGGNDYAGRAAVDSAGNFYVTGQTEVSTSPRGIIVKFSPTGDQLWASMPSSGTVGYDIGTDNSGTIFVSGATPNGTANDFFLASFTAAGTETGILVQPAVKGARGLVVAPDGNNLYVLTDTWKYYHSYGVDYVTMRFEKDGSRYIASPALLPAALVNTSYTQTLSVRGGTPPYLWSVTSGTLPPGVSLDPASGILSGTADGTGRHDFTLQVQDGAGVIMTKAMTLYVAAAVTIVNGAPTTGLAGVPYSHQFQATGGMPPYAWSVSSGSLPPGLTLDVAKGILTGNPTTVGTYSFTVKCAGALALGSEISVSMPIVDWKNISTNGGKSWGRAVTVDSAGNAFVVGDYTSPSNSEGNILVTKHDAAGTLLWQKTYDGLSYDYGNDIAVDGAGNVLVAGTDNNRCVLLKYDGAGTLLWTKVHDGDASYCYRLALDSTGNAYLTGMAAVGIPDGSGGTSYSYDAWTAKYDHNGTQLWSSSHGKAITWEKGADLALDSAGNIYVIGSQDTGEDAFLLKYNADGVLLLTKPIVTWPKRIVVAGSDTLYVWAGSHVTVFDTSGNQLKSYPGSYEGDITDMAVDGDGTLFLTGSVGTTSGTRNYYTAQYDATWNEVWHTIFDRGGDDAAYGIALDGKGVVYVTGGSSGEVVTLKYFLPEITTTVLPTGNTGIFYQAVLAATGGLPPYTWAFTDGSFLPTGLTLYSATGVIEGVPVCGGTFSLTLAVTNLNGVTDRKTMDLVVSGTGSGIEICDGIDNDCNGLIDDADPGVTGQKTWYYDYDNDTFGNPGLPKLSCTQPYGYVADNADCNDYNAKIKPGASEVCDKVDNDCNGLTDDADPNVIGKETWYRDADGDNYGDPNVTILACYQPAGYVSYMFNTDCNDADAHVWPGYPELCFDGIDNNCNGLIDSADNCQMLSCNSNAECLGNTFCRKASGNCSYGGWCMPPPESCPPANDPVCGCDGQTYTNSCEAEQHGVSIATAGACPVHSYSYYFPSIKDNDASGWENYLSVQAKEPVAMEVRIRVYDMFGVLKGTYIYSDTDPLAKGAAIAPNARVAQRPSWIAGSASAPVAIEGSVIVETSVPAIASINCIANFYKGFSLYEAAKPRQIHNFPKAFDGPDNYQVYMLVQNIHPNAINVTAQLFGKTPAEPGHGATKTVVIPAYGTLKIRPSEVAPPDPVTGRAINFSGSVVISADLAVPAMCRYEAGVEALAIYESTVEQPALSFPVIKDGRFGGTLDFQNFVSVVNPSTTTAATITMILYNLAGQEEGRLSNSKIAAGGKNTWRPSWIKGSLALPKDFVGSIVVNSDIPVVGQTNTIYPGNNQYGADGFDLFESAIPAPSLFFPKAYDNLLGSGTGATKLFDNFVYVQNPDGTLKTVTVELFNNNGTANGFRTVSIGANATHTFRPKDLVLDTTGTFRGSVRVTETSGLPVTGGLKYEFHRTTSPSSVIEAMTIYRSMGQ